ncbi:PDZ domain-containing protein [Jeotgalibacillus proteolyticus]|uniref:PDZ domain-containing protein n=1 Tax=Jeotgalibacillus proteolyticus TaxID=2082395 RepID=UPI001431CC43|nr:PDZ domain-containing protein [Jeotgalibacillus proteolyticus]
MFDLVNLWIQEAGEGALAMLLNPVLYAAIAAVIIAGVLRVKRERRDLRTGIVSPAVELKSLFGLGILIGIGLSAIILAAGIVISSAWIYIISALMLLGLITWQFRALSPALLIPLAAGGLYALYYFNVTLPSWAPELPEEAGLIGTISIIMGLLLFAEGLLITLNAGKKTSARFIRTPRGLKAGAFFTQRLWLVPLFLLVPMGSLEGLGGWWPVFTFGSFSFSLIAVPFVIGFQLTVVHDLPAPVIRKAGQEVIWLSTLVTVLAIAGYFAPYLFIAAFSVAFIGRIYLALKLRALCRRSGYHFMNKERGVMVVDVIPGTPADKLGIVRGELVSKINGESVRDEREFYKALQKNRVHCKLEVLNHQGEIRFMQRALHEGQHHLLGIIMVEDRMRSYTSDSA